MFLRHYMKLKDFVGRRLHLPGTAPLFNSRPRKYQRPHGTGIHTSFLRADQHCRLLPCVPGCWRCERRSAREATAVSEEGYGVYVAGVDLPQVSSQKHLHRGSERSVICGLHTYHVQEICADAVEFQYTVDVSPTQDYGRSESS